VSKANVRGKEIVEIKDITGSIDEEQFGAYVDALRDDKVRAELGAESLRYVFTKPEGAIANLEFLRNAFDKERLVGRLTIEVYTRDGTVRTATTRAEAMQLLTSLGAP
jgi:hypothetical protein